MLDAIYFDALSRLQLRMSHKSSLHMSGSHRSLRKGNSTEFSDFREYMPGDDLRRMDWNIYARSDKLYIREYMEEKEACVSVLLDTSASMDYGKSSKAELAKDLAAVVGFLALNNMDRVLLYDMKDMGRPLSVGGGRNAFDKVLGWLGQVEFSGEADMLSATRKMQCRGAGVTVLISDFLHPAMFLHTMAAEELHVTFNGALNLIDAETGQRRRLEVDAKAIDHYEQELSRFIGRLKKGCACGRGGSFRGAGGDHIIFAEAAGERLPDLLQLVVG